MNNDIAGKVISTSSSSPSSSSFRLYQLLDRTRNEIIVGIQNDHSNNNNNISNENNDDEGDEQIDIAAITEDIQQFTMTERGNELRDCARYDDYIVLHTLLYVTATTQDDVREKADSTPIHSSNDKDSTVHPVTSTTTSAVDRLQELLHSPDPHTGNTALHMAAANNHSSIVQFLLQIEQAIIYDKDNNNKEDGQNNNMKQSSSSSSSSSSIKPQHEERSLRLVQRTNTSGKNTPLHYAVTNRALESIRFLLQDYSNTTNIATYTNPDIDVLQQNAAGRSSLTEAFALTSSSSSLSSDQNTNERSDVDDETKRNHEILTLLLEHPSANEDRLIQSSSTKDHKSQPVSSATEHTEQPNPIVELPPCHTHHFRLVGSTKMDGDNGIELHIREMAMAPPCSNAETEPVTTRSKTEQNTNDLIHILGGTVPMNDTTGFGIWSASIIMGQWMTDVFYNCRNNTNKQYAAPEETPIRTILELGAGCGIPGITVAKSFVARSDVVPSQLPTIYVTDLNPTTLRNLQHNVTTNRVDVITSVVSLDWNELIHGDNDTIWPWMGTSTETSNDEQLSAETNGIDVLIGSDLVYQKEVVPILLQTIHKLRPKKFYYGAAGTNRDGHDLFIQSLQEQMTLVASCPAPIRYRTTNPLHNQDDDECFVHFQDLLLLSTNDNISDDCDDTFQLYEFAAIQK